MPGKAVFSAKSSYGKTELQNLILKAVDNNTDLLEGKVSFTESGGKEDKQLKIDAYIGKSPVQVKMDYRSMVNHTTAVEFVQIDLVTINYKHGHFIDTPKAGGVSERPLIDNVQYLYYVLPGEGIAIWEPAKLSRLVFHTMRSIPIDFNPQLIGFGGEALKGKNCFKIAVAANKEGSDNMWSSLNYLLPNEFLMAEEGIPLGEWEIKKTFDNGVVYEDAIFHPNEDDVGERTYIKPHRIIPWSEVLYAIRTDDAYPRIVELVSQHILDYKYGRRKAYIIADHFDMNVEHLELYDWANHQE